ncbi:calcium-binding protein [Streptomyces sp. NPDC058256]|uniref:calcium-binding protein n=1 Tax=Streptomyces sp. NPDC058256 TaxID=3346408 RepID=UPI0036ECD19E
MRIRVAAAAGTASAALLMTAFVSPAAQAGDAPVITKVVVNKGKKIVIGPTAATNFSAQITAKHPGGVSTAYVNLWHGASRDSADRAFSYDAPRCTTSGTATTCTMNFSVLADTRDMTNVVSNAQAGTWHIYAYAYGKDRTETAIDDYATTTVQRAAKLTANASPEPVTKGKTLTVTGTLTRANWNTHKYAGYSGQKAALQYRPKNSTTYTTVKTLTTNSTGKLSTTVKATADGFYRFTYAGTSATAAATAPGDYIDVK